MIPPFTPSGFRTAPISSSSSKTPTTPSPPKRFSHRWAAYLQAGPLVFMGMDVVLPAGIPCRQARGSGTPLTGPSPKTPGSMPISQRVGRGVIPSPLTPTEAAAGVQRIRLGTEPCGDGLPTPGGRAIHSGAGAGRRSTGSSRMSGLPFLTTPPSMPGGSKTAALPLPLTPTEAAAASRP